MKLLFGDGVRAPLDEDYRGAEKPWERPGAIRPSREISLIPESKAQSANVSRIRDPWRKAGEILPNSWDFFRRELHLGSQMQLSRIQEDKKGDIMKRFAGLFVLLPATAGFISTGVRADEVTDWNGIMLEAAHDAVPPTSRS